ncbi:alcohol dehydrogenase 1-like [Chrysoperla carnea]|uniref:alcohol dehydrogenase 1-like n=1 Tax=Chrysoperla carnea TaxID=189513 RepID=UPI001D05DBF5|nr:alcohol dehydrogenase 1-like [Chrysoperla carnea]
MLDVDEKNGERASKELNDECCRDCTCFHKVDVTCHEEFEEAFKNCLKWVRKLDLVFNNAGILNDHKWKETVAINTTGMIRGTMFAFKYMGIDQGGCGGIVVNNASILGLQPLAGSPVYCGTKHAAVGMTRSWGTPFWYDRTGIKFMAILPGVTDTNMITGAHGPDDPLTKELARGLDSLAPQPVDKIGDHFATIITQGSNGSLWVSENGETYEVEIPDRSALKHIK